MEPVARVRQMQRGLSELLHVLPRPSLWTVGSVRGKVEMIKPGRYKHYKGNMYEVIGIAKHSETLEEMVVYRALYGDGCLWVRPASMWEETVTVNGVQNPRFEFCE